MKDYRLLHTCTGLEAIGEPRPFFYKMDEAIDTQTNEKIQPVMLAFVTNSGSTGAIMVDYCAWCGTQLTVYTRQRSKDIVDEQASYLVYLKLRAAQVGTQGRYMMPDEWREVHREYEETKMLARHAKDDTKEGLTNRLIVLRERLGIGQDGQDDRQLGI